MNSKLKKVLSIAKECNTLEEALSFRCPGLTVSYTKSLVLKLVSTGHLFFGGDGI